MPFLGDIIHENIVGGAYDYLDIVGRVVVDVSAGVSDTAILFALRGADKVIALEPYPSLYRVGLTNIRLNGLEGKISLINGGLGGFNGDVCAELSNVGRL